MNNEIGRKITSLTLMTIMLAAGFTAFAPSVMPQAAAANANLFVSAENSQFQNYFAGPMVIEVVVIDSDIKDTDKGKGEPDVTVNGNKLRMVQATDGNWYGYFADRKQAQIADSTVTGTAGFGLDFGKFCTAASAGTLLGFSVSQTVGVAVSTAVTGGTDGNTAGTSFGTCTAIGTNPRINNVVRENKTVNPGGGGTGVPIGQIGFASQNAKGQLWPLIQLYDFNPTGNVVVQYNKGGGVQSTTLKFDTVDQFAKLDLDRQVYPQRAQVHVTITDLQLNIDPTDEDSWTFQTNVANTLATIYQAFDENGNQAGDGNAAGINNIASSLANLMFEDNGVLKLNVQAQGATPVVTIQDNADTQTTGTSAATAASAGSGAHGFLTAGTQPVTITESGPNTGIFGTYDESDVSVLAITNDAARGTSATIDYNKKPKTVLVGFGFASIDIKPTDVEWNSGEEIPVVLTDSDANKNSRADEDLDFNEPLVDLIPALSTGDPFTLGEAGVETPKYAVAFINATTTSNTAAGQVNPANNIIASGGPDQGVGTNMTVQKFSERGMISNQYNQTAWVSSGVVIDLETTASELYSSIKDPRGSANNAARFHGFNLLNLDLRSLGVTSAKVWLLAAPTDILVGNPAVKNYQLAPGARAIALANVTSAQQLVMLNRTSTANTAANIDADTVVANLFGITNTNKIGLLINYSSTPIGANTQPIAVDFFTFGFVGDGLKKTERFNNQIVRVEAEETGDNTGVFEGTLEYIMVNQLNILDPATYQNLETIADDPNFIVHQDLDDEESPRISYNDRGADGVITQVSDQQAAPAHSGVVSFDKPTYKKADTVIVTLQDQDLNTDVDLIDIYTPVDVAGDAAQGTIGRAGLFTLTNGDPLGRLLDITFDDQTWRTDSNSPTATHVANKAACVGLLAGEKIDTGLISAGFTLIETGPATGIFTADFQVPGKVCLIGDSSPRNVQGLDMEVNYVDFRDASGQMIEVGDGAGIRANTGSVSLDRTVYPVPWGEVADFTGVATDETVPDGRSIFPVHLTAVGDNSITSAMTLGDGTLTIHVQVNDPDFDVSASGEDTIAENATSTTGADLKRGPVKVTISRANQKVTLAYAGGTVANNGVIDVGDNNLVLASIRQLGPIKETTPSSGIFEFDLDIRYTDGPASVQCPTTAAAGYVSLVKPGTRAGILERFDAPNANNNNCILQGDIITVEYTDPADASGRKNTVTDSATFDLRNGALQSDKSVYIIGSDMILTLIEPDFDLDNDLAETYDLDLIEWDSDAATLTMGDLGGQSAKFDPEPSDLRETGDSTGIFQAVIEIPRTLNNDALERGEEIVLEYTDWGPSGAKYVGAEDEDINLTIFTSNFGATVELDQKVYTWTDKVYITVIAPDHNFDSNLIDEIGGSKADPLRVATRSDRLNNYRLTETGTDTGIFTGEVILTGFQPHDADGDGDDTDAPNITIGTGPTNGFLRARDDDGLTVSYEFSEDETVVGSALIRWNIGEVMWLEASYPASGTGVVRVIDPDMNLNPEAVDNFKVDVWSDSDAGGIDLTVTETNEATGIFEGTVFFTTTDSSSGHRLRVAEGDTVTAEYEDNTLPAPYTRADELDITGTAFIGTVVPPLERAPASNPRVVDSFGNTLNRVSVDQQVQITADLTNGQDREQQFAYLVQITNEDGVTVSLAWITGSLTAGQSFSPALSWTPNESGTYTATVYVWESVENPTALSPPVSVDITVS